MVTLSGISNKVLKDNVFICYTPLQILIAEKIIELEKIDSFILIFYFEKDNAKSRYYFNKLSQNAKQAFYIKKDNKIFSALKTFHFLYLKIWKSSSHCNFFTGNIKSAYSRVIIYLLGFSKLYTFDDGLSNVCGDGYFYENIEPSSIARLLSFFGLDFSYSKMYYNIEKHYSIYKVPNVMPNSRYINLFNYASVKNYSNNNGTEVVILLTSTLFEEGLVRLDLEKELYEKIITKYNVTHVIRHPLEKVTKLESSNVIINESEKIAEEIVLDLRKQYDKIKIIGVYSSAQVNLKGMDGIEIVNVHCDFNLPTENIKKLLFSFNIKTEYI